MQVGGGGGNRTRALVFEKRRRCALMVDSYLVGREQRICGASGRGFRDTRMGELVVDSGLVNGPDHGVGIWG